MAVEEPAGLETLDAHRPRAALRPELRAHTHAISSGHYLATQAGMRILDSGGNAVDAGVAAGICLGILLSDFVSFAGVAPIMVYDALPGVVRGEARLGARTFRALAERGHRMEPWPEWSWLAGAVCAIHGDRAAGLLTAAADPRREAYAAGW